MVGDAADRTHWQRHEARTSKEQLAGTSASSQLIHQGKWGPTLEVLELGRLLIWADILAAAVGSVGAACLPRSCCCDLRAAVPPGCTCA